MLKLVYRHFHDGNDANHSVRGSSIYATRCRLINTTTKAVLSEGWSFCNPTDHPSRELGRRYAAGRVFEQCQAILDNQKEINETVKIHRQTKALEALPPSDIAHLV